MEDYYKLLGIDSKASLEEIKAAYRQAAFKYHPDTSKEDTSETFKKVNEAFVVLSDPSKRDNYDAKRPKPKARVGKKKKESKQKASSPFNFTIDVNVGNVDVWNPVERKLTPQEEMLIENEKEAAAERAKLKAERMSRRIGNYWVWGG